MQLKARFKELTGQLFYSTILKVWSCRSYTGMETM